MNLRVAVRALVVDDADRVALVRFDFPDGAVWAAPGGGVEAGEDDVTALRRELHEELGLELTEPLGRPVWLRTHLFPMTRWDGQTERYYLLRVRPFELRPALGADMLRDEGVGEIRWWSRDELDEAADVRFAPRRFPALLRTLLEEGAAAEPLDVGV